MKKEKQEILNTLRAATQKAAKKVQQGLLVSDEEFFEIVETTNKNSIFLGFIEKVNYQYGIGVGIPEVKIYCRWNNILFKCSFYLKNPPGTYKDKKKVICGVNVEEGMIND